MACILTKHITQWACLGCSGLALYDSEFQFSPISCNFAQPLNRSGTINNLINSMRRRCDALHEANGGHTRYWLVFWSMPLLFFKAWPTDSYLYSQSCEIHILGPHIFILTDFLIWTVIQFSKILEIVACYVYFFLCSNIWYSDLCKNQMNPGPN